MFFPKRERPSFTLVQKTGKIIGLYILIIKFTERRWKDKERERF